MELINWVIGTVIVGVSILIGIGYKKVVKSAKDDNPVEELCEKIVKEKTGFDFDFTPKSPETESKPIMKEDAK